jgi:hypothetical protein
MLLNFAGTSSAGFGLGESLTLLKKKKELLSLLYKKKEFLHE